MARPQSPGAGDKAGVDRFLRWGLVVTVLVAVGILIYGTVAVYQGRPPIPDRVVAPDGAVVFTRSNILDGRAVFQRTDLMDFGSLYGNGAYFGPDWGTDYIHRQGLFEQAYYSQQRFGTTYANLSPTDRQAVDTLVADDMKTNRYSNGALTLTAAQVAAYGNIQGYYRGLFLNGDKQLGLPPNTVRDATEADQLTAFFGWAGWTSVAQRPGATYSYTNNWPNEPLAGNRATGSLWLWTWASIAGLAVVSTAVFLFYKRYIATPSSAIKAPASAPGSEASEPPLTPSQASTAKWFILVPALLLLQTLAGILIAHNYAQRQGFFGFDIASVLPFNVLKAWHLQLAIAWVAAAWLGAGLFLAPIVGRREPKHQRLLANILWVAVVLVVIGGGIGLWFGVKSNMKGSWFWFGNQGLEYIQLGRAFQIALFAGLLIWALILLRTFWPGLRQKRTWGSLEYLLLYSGAAIGVVYVFGMLPVSKIMDSFTLTDFWRWWVVHLWVENAFEFFTVAVTGYALLSMGLLSRKLVERTVYFELILILGSGIVGTGHHYYWIGEPAVWVSLGAMFSFLEVIPLGLMLFSAWRQYRVIRAAGESFPQRTAFMFFTSAAAWNVLGAGVIGAIINTPIMSYYSHGQFLTLAHGHASMMGTFGLLAIGLVYFCMGSLTKVPRTPRADLLPRLALYCFNGGIVLWLALNLLPIGFAQLVSNVHNGYWFSRSLSFYDGWNLFQWLRMPGDVVFGIGGLLVLIDMVWKLLSRKPANVADGQALPAEKPGKELVA